MARRWPAGFGPTPDAETVRDDQGQTWNLGEDGRYHDTTGRHHHTPHNLHMRTDLEDAS